jgi:isopenicillin N synthase-like dioxygenase
MRVLRTKKLMDIDIARCRQIIAEFRSFGFSEVELPERLSERLLALAWSFYAKPLNERMALAAFRTRSVLGYSPAERVAEEYGEQHGERIPAFEGRRKRGYCSFDYIANERVLASCDLFKDNRWPRGDEKFRREACQLYDDVCAFMKEACGTVLAELRRTDNVKNVWPDLFDKDCCCIMRLLKYEKTGIEMESKAHTDYEFITLVKSTAQGLEVKSPSGEWQKPYCHPGRALLVPGDMLEVITDGWIQSALHRVRFGLEERVAVVFFQGLELNERIGYSAPDPEFADTFGGHLCGMLVRSSPHLMAEVAFWEEKLRVRIPERNPFRSKKG